MKAYFLGTNGWYDTQSGNTVCLLLETKDRYMVFDAGNGIYKLDRYIKKNKPVYLFLSHFHLDHIVGLHILAKFDFKQGMDVYGPPGLKKMFKDVISYPYTLPVGKLKIPVRLHEIKPGNLAAGVSALPLKHSSVCYGYRVEAEGKTVTFCTDTGPCKNLITLAKNTDLLITECSYKSGQSDAAWPHLNPENAAKAARKAKAKKMVLIHFDAALYLDHQQRQAAARQARKIFKHTTAGRDNLEVNL